MAYITDASSIKRILDHLGLSPPEQKEPPPVREVVMVALVLARPDEALRRLAGPFKAREGRMEQAFWQSRFRR